MIRTHKFLDHLLSSVEPIIKKKCGAVNRNFWQRNFWLSGHLVYVVASGISLTVIILPALPAVIRDKMNPIVVDAFLVVEDWRWIRIATTGSAVTTATLERLALTGLETLIGSIWTGRTDADAAIAPIVNSVWAAAAVALRSRIKAIVGGLTRVWKTIGSRVRTVAEPHGLAERTVNAGTI